MTEHRYKRRSKRRKRRTSLWKRGEDGTEKRLGMENELPPASQYTRQRYAAAAAAATATQPTFTHRRDGGGLGPA
jgi:hypothetical protein